MALEISVFFILHMRNHTDFRDLLTGRDVSVAEQIINDKPNSDFFKRNNIYCDSSQG